MLRLTRIATIALLIVFPALALAGARVTANNAWRDAQGGMHYKFSVAVTSDASGDASVGITFHGVLTQVESDPGATAPTPEWDMVLTSEGGVDAFGTRGMNRSATVSESFVPAIDGVDTFPRLHGPYTLTFSNMGNAKVVTVYLYVSE